MRNIAGQAEGNLEALGKGPVRVPLIEALKHFIEINLVALGLYVKLLKAGDAGDLFMCPTRRADIENLWISQRRCVVVLKEDFVDVRKPTLKKVGILRP